MRGRMKMLRRVLADRRVTAADVAARQADAKVDPFHALRETFFATVALGLDVLRLIEMRVFTFHR
jgi:hypothetical protein